MNATEDQTDDPCRSVTDTEAQVQKTFITEEQTDGISNATTEAKVTELVKELDETRVKLKAALKSAEKAERLYQRALTYNEDLRKQLDQLSRKLHRYKSKSPANKCDISTQTPAQDVPLDLNGDPSQSSVKWSENGTESRLYTQQPTAPAAEKEVSLAESLRQTAQEAVDNTGFVYDESTGLYYDSNSGYFYDNENSLYFDPSSGTYFYYDDEAQEYKFHSQVDMTQYYANQCYSGDHSGLPSHQNPKKHRRKNKEEKENMQSTRRSRKRKKIDTENRDGNTTEVMETDESDQIKCKLKSTSLQSDPKTAVELVINCDNSDTQHLDNVKLADVNKNSETARSGLSTTSVTDQGKKSDSESDGSHSDPESELESGELTESEETDSEEDCDMSGVIEDEETEECNPVNYPPCIRMMVAQSDVVDPGTLYIVTYPGGTIGREGSHVICLPELNVSKVHAEIQYSDSDQSYVIVDRGSQNGTFLNDTRIAEPKCPGDPCNLNHGDQLIIGSSHILCHIHAGLETCDLCEPGQVLASLQAQTSQKEEVVILSKEEKEKERRKQLKSIRKKYGLANVDYIQSERVPQGEGYTDKADERRRTVGSDNPYQKTEAPASVHRPIPTTNKGHKMMQKMGWTEGGGLGKGSDGIQEPVKVSFRLNKSAGLGSSLEGKTSLDSAGGGRSQQNWLRAQQRFNALGGGDSDTEKGPSQGTATPVKPQTTGTELSKPGFQWVQGKTLDLNSEKDGPNSGQVDNS